MPTCRTVSHTSAPTQLLPPVPRGGYAHPARLLGRVLLGLTLLAAGLSCATVKLVSDYDEKTDTAITAFEREIDGYLGKLVSNAGTPVAAYASNSTFYAGARDDIRAMQFRARALPKNRITVEQLDLLMRSLDALESLHRSAGPTGIPADQVTPLRNAFDASCTAILKFEIEKKRGKAKDAK
jgi:hypothetical protein